MCFYQPNPPYKKAEATLYRSPELFLCEVEETRCEIEVTTDIMDMDMDVSPASDQMEVDSDDESDDESDDGYGGGDIPFHTPHNHTTLQKLQKQKRKRNMPIPVTSNLTPTPTTGTASSHTPRITKPRGFFRREPLSLPAMRLREKWKESVSVKAETALWSGFEFGSGFGFGAIQTGTGFGTGAVGDVGSGRGQGRQGQARRFYRGREIGHGLPY